MMARLVFNWWKFQGKYKQLFFFLPKWSHQMSDLRGNAIKHMFPHTNFFNSFSAFSALGGLLSWWRGRSGAAGWLCCTDWEQREQLMIAYHRPRFTPSSCFWEWASSTAPQRRVCIWDLTFSNLIKLDEKKPSSAYDPPPTSPEMEWLWRCSSTISSERIVSLKEQSYLCSNLMLREKENVWAFFFFFFLLWHDPLRWLYGLVSYGYLGYIFCLVTAAFTSKQFDRGCFSSADDGRELRILQPQTATSECEAHVTRCSRNPDDRNFPVTLSYILFLLQDFEQIIHAFFFLSFCIHEMDI